MFSFEATSNEIISSVTEVSNSLTSIINIGMIGKIIGVVLLAGTGLFVGWFAIRKVIRVVKGALKGKLSV